MVWRATDPQGGESLKIKWELVEYTRGVGLDLGCGPNKAFQHFIGVDNNADAHLFGIQCKPDIDIVDAAKLPLFASQSMDFVFSSHLLEHIDDYKAALKEWWRVVRPDGYLILYLPHADFYPKVGEPGANPDHRHNLWPSTVIEAMKEVSDCWDLVECQERNNDNEYSFLVIFKRASWAGNRTTLMKSSPDIRQMLTQSPVASIGPAQ